MARARAHSYRQLVATDFAEGFFGWRRYGEDGDPCGAEDHYLNMWAAEVVDAGSAPTLQNWHLQKVKELACFEKNIQRTPHTMRCGWYVIG